jgi:16S rRNA (adenine1518-N6/adenine1519-N6)-dimethyltransferase
MGFQDRVRPKKSLGQNFFTNDSLGQQIVDTVILSEPKHITEVGPGLGFFTERFVKSNIPVTVIEKDSELAENLKSMFPSIEVVNMDMLEYINTHTDTTYFGSLPYNVSKPIIRSIITSESFVNPAFFIIQKEVAQKYIQKDNILGLTSQLFCESKILFHISPGSFNPKPKVTSSFVTFTPTSRYSNVNISKVEELIKRAFAHPRKTVNNNLKNFTYNLTEEEKQKRPEELSLEEYISILQRS